TTDDIHLVKEAYEVSVAHNHSLFWNRKFFIGIRLTFHFKLGICQVFSYNNRVVIKVEECWLMNKRLSIAIDGPAAAGKSTVAKQNAQELSIVYVDTGGMYRALTLKARNLSVDLSDETALAHLLMQTKIELQFSNETQRILLDGEDVTEEIRNND